MSIKVSNLTKLYGQQKAVDDISFEVSKGEVLGFLVKGHLSKEVADRLFISVETVNYHLKQIYRKMHVRSRTEAVVKYLRQLR